jgi:single-stranded-DNA-specific exonuclease
MLSEKDFQRCGEAGVEAILAQLLHNRGLTTPETMRSFLDARYDQTLDPHALIDMDKALERIRRAIDQREHITVYGDYDADGVTSSALLTRALRTLKQPEATLDFHIPSRLHDGCGLNIKAIDLLKARGTSLIITTDCASSDVDQVDYANSLGIDVIITDHHQPPAQLPAAYAIINPWRPDCTYSERYLCGVGIAFKLTQALYRSYGCPREEEQTLLDLVAIGTVGDVAPLLGENHTLVRLGLQQLNQTRKPGLLALFRRAGLQPGRIRERDIAYGLAPRINAAGRMKDASTAFLLLTTDDEAEAAGYVEELESLNLSRQRQTEELMNLARLEAQQRLDDSVVLVSGDNWPEGIIGLVAGKLSEEIHRPVLVLSRGPEFSRGSARSQNNLNIIAALRDCALLLERYGGHAQAAGFTVANSRIEELREHFLRWQEEHAHERASGALGALGAVASTTPSEETAAVVDVAEKLAIPDPTGVVTETEGENGAASTTNRQMIDLVFKRLARVNYDQYAAIQQLGPFGAANPEPTFKIEQLRIQELWTSGVEGRNLRLVLVAEREQSPLKFKGTIMRGGDLRFSLQRGQKVNVIFRLEASWNAIDDGRKPETWLKILHVEPL